MSVNCFLFNLNISIHSLNFLQNNVLLILVETQAFSTQTRITGSVVYQMTADRVIMSWFILFHLNPKQFSAVSQQSICKQLCSQVMFRLGSLVSLSVCSCQLSIVKQSTRSQKPLTWKQSQFSNKLYCFTITLTLHLYQYHCILMDLGMGLSSLQQRH